MSPITAHLPRLHRDVRNRRLLRSGLLAALVFGAGCTVDENGNTILDTKVIEGVVNDPLGSAKDQIIVSKVENAGGGSESETAVVYNPSTASCGDAVALTDLPVDKFDEASGMSVFKSSSGSALLSLEPPQFIVIGNGKGGVDAEGNSGPTEDDKYKKQADSVAWNFGQWVPLVNGLPDVDNAKTILLPLPPIGTYFDAESFAVEDCGELNPDDPTRKCLVIANTDRNAKDDTAVLVYMFGSDPADPLNGIKLVNYIPVDTQQVLTRGTGESYTPDGRLHFQAMAVYPTDDAFANRNGCGTITTLLPEAVTCNRTLHPERGGTLVFLTRTDADSATIDPTFAFAMAPEVWRNNKNFLKGTYTPHILESLGEIPLLFLAAANARAQGRTEEFLANLPAGPQRALAEKVLTSNATDLTLEELRAAQSVDFGGETAAQIYERLYDLGWNEAHESDFFWAMANQALFFPIGQPLAISSYSGILILDVDVFALPKTQALLALNVAQFLPSTLPQTEAFSAEFGVDDDGQVTAAFSLASEVEQNNKGQLVADPDPQPMVSFNCTFVPVTALKAK